MPLAGGTKCCPNVDDSTKIIMQHVVGMACPPIMNNGDGTATPSTGSYSSSLSSAGPNTLVAGAAEEEQTSTATELYYDDWYYNDASYDDK